MRTKGNRELPVKNYSDLIYFGLEFTYLILEGYTLPFYFTVKTLDDGYLLESLYEHQ